MPGWGQPLGNVVELGSFLVPGGVCEVGKDWEGMIVTVVALQLEL